MLGYILHSIGFANSGFIVFVGFSLYAASLKRSRGGGAARLRVVRRTVSCFPSGFANLVAVYILHSIGFVN